MSGGNSTGAAPPPSPPANPRSDMIFDAPGVTDYQNPTHTADNRLRVGYPRLETLGSTPTDLATARQITAPMPEDRRPDYEANGVFKAPLTSDAYADVKRALAYVPATGIVFFTGARFETYTLGNFESRVVNGAITLQAVDQTFPPPPDPANAASAEPAAEQPKPVLSYLRLGKAEPALLDADGNPLARRFDQMMDQKYVSGVGLFSDGGFNAWTRDTMNLRSNKAVNINGSAVVITSYGEANIVTYAIDKDDDNARINAGEIVDLDVNRKIININWLRPTALGWYRQIFDRSRALTFSTANKADFGIASSYGLGVGAKFEHSLAIGLSTEYSGKIGINKGFSVEIGATGAVFKHPFGAWTQEAEAELTGDMSVKLGISGIDTLPIKTGMKVFSGLLHASVAAQTLAFTTYNAVLAGSADRVLTAADAQAGGEGDNAHGMQSAFDKGIQIYEAAIALSAITAAAGCVMAAFQAVWARTRPPNLLTPTLELDMTGIKLRHGLACLEISQAGITLHAGPGMPLSLGGLTINQHAAAINHLPPIPPPLPV